MRGLFLLRIRDLLDAPSEWQKVEVQELIDTCKTFGWDFWDVADEVGTKFEVDRLKKKQFDLK